MGTNSGKSSQRWAPIMANASGAALANVLGRNIGEWVARAYRQGAKQGVLGQSLRFRARLVYVRV